MNKHCTFASLNYLFLLGIVFMAACSDAAYEPEFVSKKHDAAETLRKQQPWFRMEPDTVSAAAPKHLLISSSRSGME